MLNRKVIAQNITNLTDARYFAAWGVDYLGYNVNPDSLSYINLEKVREIKDWVEGPKCLLETNALDFNDVADGHILSNIYSSLPLNKLAFFKIDISEVLKGLPGGNYILKITNKQLDQIPLLKKADLQGLELFIDITQLDNKYIAELGDWGLVIQGGEEEKVGFKSYDELDELYEILMD